MTEYRDQDVDIFRDTRCIILQIIRSERILSIKFYLFTHHHQGRISLFMKILHVDEENTCFLFEFIYIMNYLSKNAIM